MHRNVIAAVNNYFSALLGPSFKEANKKTIEFKNIDGPTLKLIIDFCYTGHIELTCENLDKILAAASSFELVQIEKKCGQYLDERLNLETCVHHFILADKYSFVDLRKKFFDFIAENFVKLSQCNSLTVLDKRCAFEIFNSDKINTSEEAVFYAVQNWIDYNEPCRQKFIKNLLNCVRLEHIPPKVCHLL